MRNASCVHTRRASMVALMQHSAPDSGTLRDLYDALDAVEAADTQLDELAALVRLDRLVRSTRTRAMRAAHGVYTDTEIARAVGVTRQAIAQQRPKT